MGGDFVSDLPHTDGWDIGARGSDELASVRNMARVCAWWTLAAGAVVILVRYWRFEHRWFVLTGAALLQVALHGFIGVSYLLAGAISVIVAALVITTGRLMSSAMDRGSRR